MSLVDLTIREADLDALRALVRREDGTEAAAYVLCGECRIQSDPWERRSRRRLTVHAVLPVPCEDAVSASENACHLGHRVIHQASQASQG